MSVTKTQDGKWRVQCWYLDWKGERHHKCKRGFERKKDAELWERKFKGSAHEETLYMDKLIDEFKKNYITRCKLGKVKESTLEINFVLIDTYIVDYFANVDASKVKAKDINIWLSSLKPARKSINKLSSGTINNARKILRQIFKYGIVNYNLKENPVERSECVAPYSNDKREKFWTVEQYKIFYDSLKEEQHRVIFNIMYWAGLRIGEVLCLTKTDIDINAIHIVKTVNRSQKKTINKSEVNNPKTPSSNRVAKIPQKLAFQILEYIDTIPYLKNTDKIFSISLSGVTALLKRRIESLSLPYISPHNLRHSYASNLLNVTKDYTIVSHQLGHKNPDITMKFYAHMLPQEDVSAVNAINEIMTK